MKLKLLGSKLNYQNYIKINIILIMRFIFKKLRIN